MALKINNYKGVDHMLTNNSAVRKAELIAVEADAEIAELKRIIAEQKETIQDLEDELLIARMMGEYQ